MDTDLARVMVESHASQIAFEKGVIFLAGLGVILAVAWCLSWAIDDMR